MSFNPIDAAKGLFGNDFIGKAVSMLDENEANVHQAVSGMVPSVFAGVLSKAASGDLGGVLNLAKEATNSFSLSNLGGLLAGGSLLMKGADMLKGLFGDKADNVTNTISEYSGIKTSSASSLLCIAAPAALIMLGKYVTDNNMSSSGVMSFLKSQKDHILGSVPSGLNLAGALGLGSLASIGSKLSGALSGITGNTRDTETKITRMAESAADRASSGVRWLLPLLLALVAIGLIWYFAKGCKSSPTNTAAATDTMVKSVDTPVAAPVVTEMHESLKVKLPDGVELDANKGGIEDQLVTFLNDPASKAGKDVWFDFDNLNFQTGSAVITDESQKQIQNITAILKAYPKLKIKIGGYTDKTGDSVSNMKLSADRAKSVLTALKAAGSNASQLAGSEGYGSQFAKAAADASDDDRKKDRRISVGVRAK